MNVVKRLFITIALVFVGIIGVAAYRWLNRVQPAVSVNRQSTAPIQPSPQASIAATTSEERQLPGGPYVSSDPRWAIIREKDKVDHNWEWRMPINFYGRVVDQNEEPVSAAKIHAEWSDFSPNGASSEDTLSDAQGSFSITGKMG